MDFVKGGKKYFFFFYIPRIFIFLVYIIYIYIFIYYIDLYSFFIFSKTNKQKTLNNYKWLESGFVLRWISFHCTRNEYLCITKGMGNALCFITHFPLPSGRLSNWWLVKLCASKLTLF